MYTAVNADSQFGIHTKEGYLNRMRKSSDSTAETGSTASSCEESDSDSDLDFSLASCATEKKPLGAFYSGKSLTASVGVDAAKKPSNKMCPMHWDESYVETLYTYLAISSAALGLAVAIKSLRQR